ncbi:AMP-dependent synthetase [Mycolicibacterium novocastrense]|uniref:AMP-binding protein n=1 Tax=Mycolicibacterium novocastrense TaxID=59813 RepID=UPI000749C8F2|nr:AMP-binding protein [Mycolicibacterium novocastrense]KUH69557.1 AMP-dependent synthetase [Mycolicibacterium novocastrense]KUH76490.1 AMP-dependent synthetase [Mycolicibacterium novocastrense]KUH78842.1 AMP-dependent synthetase [Mycolicibacterium novocastrense]
MTNPLIEHLRGYGDNVAVHTDTQHVTYAALADRVAGVMPDLGGSRRLVLLETRNDIDTLVHYLAALAADHVVLPVPAGREHSTILRTYEPDTVVGDGVIRHRRSAGARRLHEDLAMLMSTSGTTGSPKLVRLSRDNLLSNACAISGYLDIRETDRAATTLPMSYCYGLSVVNSHLLRGAGLILTDLSVTDERFWDLFRRHRGTSFAGVPYTFELLEQMRFDATDLPDLRYVTQAGGRMPAERVRRFAEQARNEGWQLFVMYGATEATARMAYLPPELALSRPESIGRPIPGGSFTIESTDEWPDEAVGELVYRGPNVMMGYAHGPDDLALDKTVESLHTGDLARRTPDGLYEIVGRTSRFVKMYGLRIDLQRIESALSAGGITAFCTNDDDRLVVAAAGAHSERDVQRIAAETAGVPSSAVRAVVVDELPLLESGKPDYRTVRDLARGRDAAPTTDLREVFADVLQLDPATIDPNASFVDLGGNSLSYVAMSVRLERALGQLPAGWQQLPLRELERLVKRPRTRRRLWDATLETSVAMRAVAIIVIVGSHAELFELWGGAHLLLGIAGYNFGRFCLTPVSRVKRVRHLRNTIGWIAVPSVLWVALVMPWTSDYTWTNLLLANKILGPHDSMTAGRLWFVEILVWTLVALALLLCIPAMDRAERRRPFAVAVAFLVAGLALRYDVFGWDLGRDAWFTMLAFWFFAIGWAASKAGTTLQRALLTLVLAVALYGYFENTLRELLVFGGLALVIWLPTIRCPAALTVAAGVLAEASLYTYLVHYQVYAMFPGHPALGVIASLAVGILLTYLVTMARRRLRARRGRSVSATLSPARR